MGKGGEAEQSSLGLTKDGNRLYEDVISRGTLEYAFYRVKANRGKPGPDGVTIEEFERDLEGNLKALREELLLKKYQPGPMRRVSIPKPDGGERHLSIPNVRDRIVQQAIAWELLPFFEPEFSESSFGYREGRGQKDAVAAAKTYVAEGREWVVDMDLEKFFDTVNHDRVIHLVREKVKDRRLLKLIALMLRSGIEIDGKVAASRIGLPQGSPLSPLLSNIVLTPLDKELERRGLGFVRYADDVNLFVRSEKAAQRVLESVSDFIERKLKLKVNRTKTRVAKSGQVKFLGMTLLAGGIVVISLGSMKKAQEKVRELVPRSGTGGFERQLAKVNLWYRGWSAYYSMTEYPSQLKKIEANLRMRFRLQFIKNHKRKKHLVRKLKKRGIKGGTAYRSVYLGNKGRWRLAHCAAVNFAWNPAWFELQGFETRSGDQMEHWRPLSEHPRLL